MFHRLDVARFNAYFMAWMHEILPSETAGQLCLNGKILRGSGSKPRHVVSVVTSASGLSLAQVAGQGKSQELGAIPDQLALLEVREALVSLDALSCQPTVNQQII